MNSSHLFEAEAKRLRAVLEGIVLHHSMPAGESWEDAYKEVCSMAIEALSQPGCSNERTG